MQPVRTPEQIARIFGCTIDQAKAQLQANAKQLATMATKAGNGKYRGYTANQLTAHAHSFSNATK